MDFDQWRADYGRMTDDQQRAFYDDLERNYPDQRHYTAALVDRFLTIASPRSVLEMGGWKGELAGAMLARHSTIEAWTNYELSARAIAATTCRDLQYRAVPCGFRWWTAADVPWADAFIASHVIEHLSDADCVSLLSAVRARHVYLEAPLHTRQTAGWAGYCGSHIMSMDWPQIDGVLRAAGFDKIEERIGVGMYRAKD